jgi:hypothetical protein
MWFNNSRQQVFFLLGIELMIPYNALNIFLKACFAAADASSFDITTLTVDNFGGEVGDLLGTEAPNAGNLVTAAGLPDCGLVLADLDSSIETV